MNVLLRRPRQATVPVGEFVASRLESRLSREATGSFVLKVSATFLSLIQGLILARWLGAAGYGAFTYALSWIALLGIPAVLGLQQLLIRDTAAYLARSAWGSINGLLRWANRTVLIVSLSIAFLAAGAAVLLTEESDQILITFGLALFILPLTSLTTLRQAAMQGLQHVVVSQLPDMLIRPTLFIALLGGAHLFLGAGLIAPWAMGLYVAAASVALVFGTHMLRRTLPRAAAEAPPEYDTRTWVKSALPLLFIGGMFVVYERTSILLLGTIKGAELVGLYTVAFRVAQLVTFALSAVNVALGPDVSSLHAQGRTRQLQRVVTGFAWVNLLWSLSVSAVLIVFGHWILLLFGEEFALAQTALTILSVGQLMNGAMGSASLLLVMTGHERDAAVGLGISAVLNIILNALLIPRWGLEGAAVATASSMIAWNLLLAVLVYIRLRIHSTILGTVNSLGQP